MKNVSHHLVALYWLVLLSSGTLLPARSPCTLLAQSILLPKRKKREGMIAVKFPRLHNLSVSDVFSMCSPQRKSSCTENQRVLQINSSRQHEKAPHRNRLNFYTMRFKRIFCGMLIPKQHQKQYTYLILYGILQIPPNQSFDGGFAKLKNTTPVEFPL